MKLTIKSLHLEHFKGIVDKTYNFGFLTRIFSQNRLGKTTIATAWYWLLSDKDYDLNSNPNIRPDNLEECIPTVTAVLDVDGKEITICKMQKRKVEKPDANGVSKVALTNSYTVNEVPKAERDFKAYLEDLGLSFDNFLACSHPKVFTSKKQDEMRSILFKMTDSKSDYEIASMSAETADAAKLLSDYTMEEISAMQKASKKKAAEQVESIPNQIIGMEKTKVDSDVAELELANTELHRKIIEISEKLNNKSSVLEDLQDKELKLQFEKNAIYQRLNDAVISENRHFERAIRECEQELGDRERTIANNEKLITEKKDLMLYAESKRTDALNRWKSVNESSFDDTAWKFDEKETVCSLCGQALPEEKVAQLLVDFNMRKQSAENAFKENKEKLLADISADGMKQKEIIDEYKAEIQVLNNHNCTLKKELNKFTTDLEKLNKDFADFKQKQTVIEENAEYIAVGKKHSEIKAEIEKIRNSTGNNAELETEKANCEAELKSVVEKIALAQNNVRIDEQISELRMAQRNYEQAKADAEKILYQLDIVSRRKNELLTEEINKYFSVVKWKMFDYMKNGEYKPCCVPVIDGKEYGVSTNTGREIQAELDICNSLQNFFGMSVPVFLDGAESLNEKYMPKMDCQLITLSVSEDVEMKVEVM